MTNSNFQPVLSPASDSLRVPSDQPDPAGVEESAEDRYRTLLNATVMMVDDEPTTLEVVKAFLEDAGYRHFVTTSRSTRAIELVETQKPDILLLDLNMPDVTGFEILSVMRTAERYKHVPVIVLTSSDDSNTKLKALNLGATDFLAKPVDPSELALRLRNTLAAKVYQDRLAYYDALTGLPNRRLFMDRLDVTLQRSGRDRTQGAVLHIDLDRFKMINETLGHRIGDSLLKAVSARLMESVRAVDTVGRLDLENSRTNLSRLGGDEFTVLLPEVSRAEHAAYVARRVLASLGESFDVEGHELFVTPSIGIAIFPDDGADIDTLVKNADIAMYHAKQRGRNTYEFYSNEIHVRSVERLSLESHLHKALDRNQLRLFYQPKVDLRSGRIIGGEALLRWHHRERGIVSPIEFVPLAEEINLIVPFGEWVLHTACKQTKAWHTAGLGKPCISVNVSSHQFRDRRLIPTLREALDESGLEPQYLTLELTESVIMENAQENIEELHKIKSMGVRLSVDDFGTGYSSLSYLKRFPLDELKIDRTFVSDLSENTDDAAIVTAVIAMAHGLGLSVVAEGVETEAQLAFLRSKGCDEYQGFLFSKPVAATDLTALLSSAPYPDDETP